MKRRKLFSALTLGPLAAIPAVAKPREPYKYEVIYKKEYNIFHPDYQKVQERSGEVTLYVTPEEFKELKFGEVPINVGSIKHGDRFQIGTRTQTLIKATPLYL